MKTTKLISAVCTFLILMLTPGCADENTVAVIEEPQVNVLDPNPETTTFKYLALGDSYTIGHSVCVDCRFPAQLRDSIEVVIPGADVELQIIAQTGWTTINLISAINDTNPPSNHDLVTLLIGVNNQFQNRPFSLYEAEFQQLVAKARTLAGGLKENVIVISIPDYYYTPYGQNSGDTQISPEIDAYNEYAKNYCEQNNYSYINITDITRQGLSNPALVATDGLHPSELAYAKFVERILPVAIQKLKN